MLLLHQLKTWMYWKAKIRILQLWSNFKLFNLNNSYIIPILSLIGPLLGILWTFILGYGVSYLFQRFVSDTSYHLWQIIFFFTMFEAVERGLQNGRWISSTNEESWLLACTPFTTTKYLLFLWIDEEMWQGRTQFLSSLAFFVGAYIIFPVNIWKLLIALVFLNILGIFISLITTLIQYYIIKKSVYLKGRGLITNIILPFLISVFAFYGIKYLMPWFFSFPKVTGALFYKEYLNWLKTVSEPALALLQQLISFLNYDLYPFSLLSSYIIFGDSKSIIYICFYIALLTLISLLIFKVIGRKDNVVIVQKSRLDDVLLEFFMKVNHLFQPFNKGSLNSMHVRYFMSSLLQNYLTKRSIFVILGEKLWVYMALILSIMLYIPNQYKTKAGLVIAILIVVLYPTYFVWKIYSKFKMKLSFDSEGVFLQVLMGYGASPEYIYRLKTRVLRILVFPGYVLLMLLSFLLLPISWHIIVMLIIVSLMVFLVISSFVIMPSFVLPHYEYFNKQQIGEYPDQIKGLDLIRSVITLLIFPGIPILMYISNVIQTNTFIMVSMLWIIIGGLIAFILLKNIYNLRLNKFSIEEISLDRIKVVEENFLKKKLSILLGTILIYLGAIYLTFLGEFLLVGIVYIIPMISIRLILLSSFRKSI